MGCSNRRGSVAKSRGTVSVVARSGLAGRSTSERASCTSPSSQFPWVIRVEYADIKATATSGSDLAGNALYQANCSRCHGTSRRGSAEWAAAGDAYIPSLTGITAVRSREQLQSTTYFREQHEGVAVGSRVEAATLDTLYRYFLELDRRSDQQRSFVFNAFFQTVLDDRGHPGSKTPWGLLTAIDLNTGKMRWQVPFGQRDVGRSDGATARGLLNTGGVAVTAGGVLFATGTTDDKLRAYDAANGGELWSYPLPAAGSTMPTVYAVNGTQYVVVVATGGILRGFSGRSDRVIAFKLPTSRR